MTAPMDLTDDERDELVRAEANHYTAHARALRKLGDARSALRECGATITMGMDPYEELWRRTEIARRALATPATVAVSALPNDVIAAIRNPNIEIPGEASALQSVMHWQGVLPVDQFVYRPARSDTPQPAPVAVPADCEVNNNNNNNCEHVNVVPRPCDQTLAVYCKDCNAHITACWMEEHIPESLWNRACKNTDGYNPCELDRDNVCAICGEAVIKKGT